MRPYVTEKSAQLPEQRNDISYCSDGGEFLDLNLLRFGSEQVDTLASEILQPTDVDVLLLSSC
jgi:hypothetical protein